MKERVLKLTIKKKWFDLILSGEKVEEYREIKPYWIKRLWCSFFETNTEPEDFTHVHFFHGGYCGLQLPNAKFECKGIRIGEPRPEWSDNSQGNHFIIELGKRIY
jgi:hypothetical protein